MIKIPLGDASARMEALRAETQTSGAPVLLGRNRQAVPVIHPRNERSSPSFRSLEPHRRLVLRFAAGCDPSEPTLSEPPSLP